MSKNYKKPPIVEALCEFQFQEGVPWDLVIPGLIYEKLKDTYPKRNPARQFLFAVSPEQQPQIKTINRIQFKREDEKALVQIGQNLLAINILAPYTSWDEFHPMIIRSLTAYREVVNPKSIERIALRYINRFDVQGEAIEFEKLFEFRPYIGERLPKKLGPFMIGVQFPLENSGDILKIELTTGIVEKPKAAFFTLDLEYFLSQPKIVDFDNVQKWIGVAHDTIENAFESVITEKLRNSFE